MGAFLALLAAALLMPACQAAPEGARSNEKQAAAEERAGVEGRLSDSAGEVTTEDEGPRPAPAPKRFRPSPAEDYPNAKRMAARVAERLTTYGASRGASRRPPTIVKKITDDPDRRRALRAAARPLLEAGEASVGEVQYAQFGGLTAEATSVMVVVSQQTWSGSAPLAETIRTLDVRLRLVGGEWQFDELASTGGRPVQRPADLDGPAAAVLDDDRIGLPDSARWDIHAGLVDDRVLKTMLVLAERTPFDVAVFASGHPPEVFGTDSQSNHTAGRAVDVYALGGELVIDQREKGSAAFRTARWLYRRGIPELGSPWAFDGSGGRSFTDAVHADHLHIGFERN